MYFTHFEPGLADFPLPLARLRWVQHYSQFELQQNHFPSIQLLLLHLQEFFLDFLLVLNTCELLFFVMEFLERVAIRILVLLFLPITRKFTHENKSLKDILQIIVSIVELKRIKTTNLIMGTGRRSNNSTGALPTTRTKECIPNRANYGRLRLLPFRNLGKPNKNFMFSVADKRKNILNFRKTN